MPVTVEETMSIDLKQEVRNSQDLGLLQLFVGALVHEPCLRIRLAYGNELKLHFGEPQVVRNQKFGEELRGSWVLAVRASAWRCYLRPTATGLFAGFWPRTARPVKQFSPEEMTAAVGKLAGQRVTAVDPIWWHTPARPSIGLILNFADGSVFEVVPVGGEHDDPADEPLPDWELFTPFKTFVSAGPGPAWSNQPSDKPLATKPVTPG
jgi:hypothetical protein